MSSAQPGQDVLDGVFQQVVMDVQSVLKQDEKPAVSLTKLMRKKTKDLKSGDIILPRGCLKISKNRPEEQLCTDVRAKHNRFVTKISQSDHYLLAFHLNRTIVTRMVLQEIEQKGLGYGHRTLPDQGMIILRIWEPSNSLTYQRCKVVGQHVNKLLKAQGYKTLEAKSEESSLPKDVCRKALERLTDFSTGPNQASNEASEPRTQGSDSCGGDIGVNLQDIIQHHSLAKGKDGFDRNLDKVLVMEKGVPTATLMEALDIEQNILKAKQEGADQIVSCVAIVPQASVFKSQQGLLVHHCITSQAVQQRQLVVGPALAKTKQGIPETDLGQAFCKLRHDQIIEASEMRQGDSQETVSEEHFDAMTTACVNMELLQNAPHVQLHVDMSTDDPRPEHRAGAFVMYNTARLATLLANFAQEVNRGVYPALPAVNDLDLSLLREEEEWEILYLYLARYGELLSQAVEPMREGNVSVTIHTHKVTNFLTSFCKTLSSYYSRYHILGSGEAHLLPKMYARLSLMKASHTVLLNALDLLGIQALEYL